MSLGSDEQRAFILWVEYQNLSKGGTIMNKFEKALKLATIRLANIYMEESLGEPPSPGKIIQELILEAGKYSEEELTAYWKEVNSWYKEVE